MGKKAKSQNSSEIDQVNERFSENEKLLSLEEESIEESVEIFLIFKVADDFYALQSSTIKEIIHKPVIDVLPFLPPYILGLTNRQGEPYILFDLSVIFGNETQEKNATIIIDSEEMFGIQVSQIHSFVRIKVSSLKYDSMFRSSFFSFSIPFNEHEISVINPFSFLELLNKEIKNT